MHITNSTACRTTGSAVILVFAGPTASGKEEFVKVIAGKNGFKKCVSATTRAPRPGEIRGESYHYVTRGEFAKLDLLERNEFGGNLYGMPRSSLMDVIARGGRGVCHMDVNGVRRLIMSPDTALVGALMTVFVDAPNEVLIERARRRGGLTEGQIAERIRQADHERAYSHMFNYRIKNDKEGLQNIVRIGFQILLQAERRRVEIAIER